MRIILAAALVLLMAPTLRAQERIIGLLALPEVFGGAPCAPFVAEEIPLYDAPEGGSLVGSIRVDTPWAASDAGGCEGLEVRVHRVGGGREELPTREYGYEMPGATVVERRGPWFRIRLAEGTAWLPAGRDAEYYPLERLVMEGLAFLTEDFDGDLYDGVDGQSGGAPASAAERERPVRVLESARAGDQLWVHVELLSRSPCESADEPGVIVRGWIRAHAVSGAPAIWFHSRGC